MRISTHLLNTASGKPAAGVTVHLYEGEAKIVTAVTNSDGRCPNLLPDNFSLARGNYRLVFETGALFEACFYPNVTIEFRVNEPTAHYHVPLLISPYGYTTYRGS
jgi:5-hydroxyisourate hydrolase